MAKRALTVATAGGHSILFVGPSDSGKTMLRALAHELGVIAYESRLCPCGNRGDVRSDCHCTARQIESTRCKMPQADITIEVCRPTMRERNYHGTGLGEIRKIIEQVREDTEPEVGGDENRNLLKAATNELDMTPADVDTIGRVALTIARLDRSQYIQPAHVCEAINYRRRIVDRI